VSVLIVFLISRKSSLMLTTSFPGIHMSGMPPLDPNDGGGKASNPAGLYFAETNHALSDVIVPSLPFGQVAFALRGNPSDSTATSSMLKRSSEVEEAEMHAKRHRDNDVSRAESNIDSLLGRAWGPNALIEPSVNHNMSQAILTALPGNQMARNANLNDNFSVSLAGDAAGTAGAVPNFLGMNEQHALRQAGLSAQFLREHIARNQQAAANAMFLTQFGGPGFDVFGASSQQASSWGNQFQGQGGLAAAQQQAQQFAALQSFAQLDQLRQGNMVIAQPNAVFSSLMSAQGNPQHERQQDWSTLLRQISATNNIQPTMNVPGGVPDFGASSARNAATPARPESMRAALSQQHARSQQPVLELPPSEEGPIDSYAGRSFFPLGIEEDPNWLSEFHCYVRSDLVEVFRASYNDVKARNNSIAYQQVGVRCRFCAHMSPSARAGRSSAFPSSLRQMYQSFTMMLRDHFANCDAMPTQAHDKFVLLKDKPAQGATDSKRYWIYSATKIGMADSSDGLMMNEQTRAVGAQLPPFGTVANQKWEDEVYSSVPLVLPSDRPLVAEFLFVLMSQVQPIRLTEAECIGNRRSLRVGLPGFGCRYCCQQKRLGLCRMFPARRRTLPSKVNDLYDHLCRCTLCPKPVKDLIESTKHQMNTGFNADQGGDREFFDRVWSRLDHTT
jgi:hypothetical protein